MKLLEKAKIPIDMIIIVVVPFVGFLIFFMYLAGLIPAQPIVVEIPDGAVVRELGEEAEAGQEAVPESPPIAQAEPEAPLAATEVEESEDGSEALRETYEERPAGGPGAPLPAKREPIDEERAEKLKQIAKVYDQMNAASVAAIVRSMNDEDAVDILSLMNPRNAARVLAALDPQKAARLSLMLAE